jgi:hypothetical protein
VSADEMPAHMVAVDPEAAREVLGHDFTPAQARSPLRAALGGNARAATAAADKSADESLH